MPQERRLDAAIQKLLRFESETHYAADVLRTKRLVVTIIQLCYEARAWKALNEQIILLSQREAQPKQVTGIPNMCKEVEKGGKSVSHKFTFLWMFSFLADR